MRLWACLKIIIGVIFLVSFSFLYSLIHIPEIKNQDHSMNSSSLLLSIDNVDVKKHSVFVSGWIIDKKFQKTFLHREKPHKKLQYRVILKNNDTNKFYSPKTYFVVRPDVTKFFRDEADYNYSGFNSIIYKFMLPDAGVYEILLEYNNLDDKVLLKTGKFFEKR